MSALEFLFACAMTTVLTACTAVGSLLIVVSSAGAAEALVMMLGFAFAEAAVFIFSIEKICDWWHTKFD